MIMSAIASGLLYNIRSERTSQLTFSSADLPTCLIVATVRETLSRVLRHYRLTFAKRYRDTKCFHHAAQELTICCSIQTFAVFAIVNLNPEPDSNRTPPKNISCIIAMGAQDNSSQMRVCNNILRKRCIFAEPRKFYFSGKFAKLKTTIAGALLWSEGHRKVNPRWVP
jgi:hypothetical protein